MIRVDDLIWRFWSSVCTWVAFNVLGSEFTIRHLRGLALTIMVLYDLTRAATRLGCLALGLFVGFCFARGCCGGIP